MARVCQGAEKHPTSQKSSHRLGQTFDRCDESIALASMYTANHFPGIKAIICLTESGFTPLIMSRIRSSVPIYAYSPHRETPGSRGDVPRRGNHPLRPGGAAGGEGQPGRGRRVARARRGDQGRLGYPGPRATATPPRAAPTP
ncbi:pyruvate kinase alpha/beta domain-containing protein [Pseudomonas aeruginosa]